MKHVYRFLTGFIALLFLAAIIFIPYIKWGIEPGLCIIYFVVVVAGLGLCYTFGALIRVIVLKNDDGQ